MRLDRSAQMRKFPPSLEAWRDPIEKTINKTLKANFDRREANQIIKYMFRTGGKRCRPLLVVLSAEALGGKPEEALEAAAAIEIIHAATLVFDDMIDKDQVRRGAPTIHMAFSNEKALTSGLFLASKGVQLLSNYKNPEVMSIIVWNGSGHWSSHCWYRWTGSRRRSEIRKIIRDGLSDPGRYSRLYGRIR